MTSLLFAAATTPVSPVTKGGFDFSSPEGLVVAIAIIAVLLGLIAWAVRFFVFGDGHRKHSHHRHHHGHHHHHHHHHHEESESDEVDSGTAEGLVANNGDDDAADESADEHHHHHGRRQRRRRREHRPRNPTLAETGGLPPIRTDAPPGP